MYSDPNHMNHQQQAMHQQQQHYGAPPYFPGYAPQQPKNPKNYAVTSLILFILGGILHVLALIPYLGILFGCVGLLFDCTALVFLILVVASL